MTKPIPIEAAEMARRMGLPIQRRLLTRKNGHLGHWYLILATKTPLPQIVAHYDKWGFDTQFRIKPNE